jgi:hypothetical protein
MYYHKGEGGPLEGVGPETHVHKTHSIHYRIQNSENRTENAETHVHKTTNGPLIDMTLYVMLLIWANPLLGQVGGGWALGISTFLAPIGTRLMAR